MKVIKPLNQSLLYKVFEKERKNHLSVAILSFFPFDVTQGLLSEIDLWKFAGSELGKDAVDFGCGDAANKEEGLGESGVGHV